MLVTLKFVLGEGVSGSVGNVVGLIVALNVFASIVNTVLKAFFNMDLFSLRVPTGLGRFVVINGVNRAACSGRVLLTLVVNTIRVYVTVAIGTIKRAIHFNFGRSLDT